MRSRWPARTLAAVLALCVAPSVRAQPAPPRTTRKDDLARARALDEQGVRAYKEGRYNDAILLFSEAHRLGGPPSELGNVAKCHLRLDQPEEANDVIEHYLTLSGLTDEDKKEAQTQLQELRARQSTLTITSNPPGASVLVDKRPTDGTSKTPISVRVPPGAHTVSLDLAGYAPFTKELETRFGKAAIVDVELTRLKRDPSSSTLTDRPQAGGAAASPAEPVARWTFLAQVGALFPRYGGIGDAAGVAGLFRGGYRVLDGPTSIAVGLRASVAADSWTTRTGQPNSSSTCVATLAANYSATWFGAFAVVAVERRLFDRFRAGVDLGLGLAAIFAREVGGDLFTTTCRPSPGVKPALHFGVEASYHFTPQVRAVASPFLIEVHPAFDGTRSAPRDATGAWYRAGFALGVAVDL
jgi:hypothetical protein